MEFPEPPGCVLFLLRHHGAALDLLKNNHNLNPFVVTSCCRTLIVHIIAAVNSRSLNSLSFFYSLLKVIRQKKAQNLIYFILFRDMILTVEIYPLQKYLENCPFSKLQLSFIYINNCIRFKSVKYVELPP